MNTCACNYKLINILTLNSKYYQNTFLSSRRKLSLSNKIILINNDDFNCYLDIWSKYQHAILRRSVFNGSVRTEKNRIKQLLMKSFKIASMAFGVSLIAFGGYSLGCIFVLIIF